ncbi:MAG: hypothetical protein JWP91_3221 [Fibrobacteres bacterium]|nr:hypothetical protein [Fibrobacterota bacterium]
MRNGSKAALLTAGALAAVAAAMIAFSPYKRQPGFGYRVMLHTVDIAAPADAVFRFLGNSGNAGKWSVFVDHITPLNADSIRDGLPGSRRRCFCKRDETGRRWDETITEVVPGRKRRLALYDFVGFTAASDSLATEQIYESTEGGGCRLTFTVFFTKAEPAWTETLEMYLAAYTIKSIFARNMANIKRLNETGG